MVPVVKHIGTIRVCGDYILTVNQASYVETYPHPENSRKYLTIGLFKYNRILPLPLLYSSRRCIAFSGTAAYLDDIIVTGKSREENLECVLARLEHASLRLNQSMCVVMVPKIKYPVNDIDEEPKSRLMQFKTLMSLLVQQS